MYKIIGLGQNCSVAEYLKQRMVYNSNVFAFDNMITYNIPKLCNLLIENGNGIFEKYNIERAEWASSWIVRCQTYDVTSVHDVSIDLNPKNAIDFVRSFKKLSIKSLVEEISTNPNHIFFLRTNLKGTKFEDSVFLYDTLNKLRGEKPFALFVIQPKYSDGNFLNHLPNFYYYNLNNLPKWNIKEKKWMYSKEWELAINDIRKIIVTNKISFS